ncbi:hypothetical protein EDB83DRAFT_2200242, partial [Lactarius deliciosus]
IVLGRYAVEHNHELGEGNMIYTRLSDGARQQMRSLLTQKVDSQEIVRQNNLRSAATLMNQIIAPDGSRDKFADFSDVSRVARALDTETIRLHPQDGVSM